MTTDFKLESFEDSQTRKFFKYADHQDKTLYVAVKQADPEHPGYKGQKSPHVLVNITVLNEDGTFTDYNNQWIRGAVIYGFLSERVGEAFIRKLVKLPPREGSSNQSWALNGTDKESYDKMAQHILSLQQAAAEADDIPWDDDDEGDE